MALELVLPTFTLLLWTIRTLCSPQRARRALVDLAICATITMYQNKNVLLDIFTTEQLLAFGVTGLSCSIWIYICALYVTQGWRASRHHQDDTTKLKPVFYKCKTIHRRFTPKKHTFAYSYLLVGFGMSWEGNQGFLFSVNQNSCKKSPPWSLFSVNSMDYLQRGEGSLWKKLQEFLHDKDEDILDYPTIYFVTAPRFLGSSFSQIDFWYLYDREMSLKLVVVEVMNPFDERHAYLLRPANADTSSSIHFIQVTPKKLHVSPFNDRTGRYKFISHDPLRGLKDTSKAPGIDVTIILQSWDETKGRYVAKFMADLQSIEPPIHGDVIGQSLGSTINFAVRYGWIVLVDLPRVIYQALILWAVKKMRVYHKPQVLGESVCRASTELERKLELSFRKFLAVQVQYTSTPTTVSYVSAISGDSKPMVFTSEHQNSLSEERVLHLKILDPGFYVQWACMCRFPIQFLRKQLSEPDLLKRTIQISQRGAGFAEETFAQILNADSAHSEVYQKQANKHRILHQLLNVLWGVYENRTKDILGAGDSGRLNTLWNSGLYIYQGFGGSPFDILSALLTQLIAFGDVNILNMYDTLLQLAVYMGFWKSFVLPGAT